MLHTEQKKLVLEEEKVRQASRKLEKVRQSRINIEDHNKENKKELEVLEHEVQGKLNEVDLARERMNNMANLVLKAQIARLEMESQMRVDQENAAKGEHDVKDIEMSKEAQDSHIARMNDQVEMYSLQLEQTKGQTSAMENATTEIKQSLKKAEDELKLVESEKKKMFANWSNTVININKRDDALANFEDALESQKTKVKSVKTEIDSTKDEIHVCQIEHERVTGVAARIDKNNTQKKSQIGRLKKEVEESKIELARLDKVKEESEMMLDTIQKDYLELHKDNEAVKNTILDLEFQKRELEKKVIDCLRDQMASEKSSTEADRQIKEIKDKIRIVTSKLKIEQNKQLDLDREIEKVKLLQVTDRHRKDEWSVQITMLEDEEKRVSELLRTTTCAIEKVQSLINHAEKEFTELSKKNGQESSPLEADIVKCKEEIEQVSKYCNEKRKDWTKKQNELIKIHMKQDEARQDLEQARNKYTILLDKRNKNEEEIITLKETLAKVRKRIENLDFNIKKLNTTLSNDRTDIVELEKKRNAKITEGMAVVSDVDDEISTIKATISEQELNQQTALWEVRQSDSELLEWEHKVKSCQNTASHLGEEKQKGGELEHMRCEVHHLEQKLKVSIYKNFHYFNSPVFKINNII